MVYADLDFVIPVETADYRDRSTFVVVAMAGMMQAAIDEGRNKIIINTNLKLGLPMENINKIAGPMIEAWAQGVFTDVVGDTGNMYQLIDVKARERLHMADIVLQFRRSQPLPLGATAHVDVKATSQNIVSSGRAPNLTSFARIRTAYVRDPDYIFVVLNVSHRVYSTKDGPSGMTNGVMEVVGYGVYDLKHIADSDLSYNPALGTGQVQLRNVNSINLSPRTTLGFCQMLDRKFLASKKGYAAWLQLATAGGWIR